MSTEYKVRMAFDAGSGVCLWAANDSTRERYGYPIDHWQLPLCENTRRWLSHLIAWYDTSLDWDSPTDADDYWTDEESRRFEDARRRGLAVLRHELVPVGFEVVD